MNRRGLLAAGPACFLPRLARPASPSASSGTRLPISLAQWSLHRTFFGRSFGARFRKAFQADPDSVLQGARHPLEFPTMARALFGIDAVEYVNTFFYTHAGDAAYLGELKSRADDAGVRSLLIMCDALGSTGDADPEARARAVDNHRPWMDAAACLGCHAVRVNAAGQGSQEEVSERVAESLNRLGDLGAARGLDVLVENHGGLSSNGGWLAATETTIDYPRMLGIVLDAGYRGHVGIEYEGTRLSEAEGIRATKDLLERSLAEA